MGHQAIIYGRIQGARGYSQRSPTYAFEYNAAVLSSLPDHDGDWPFLTRHMFATADRSFSGDADRGLYKSQIIHFGASLKDEPTQEGHWNEWLVKFEHLLLRKLAWCSAVVHIETDFRPGRAYIYRVDWDSLAELLLELKGLAHAAGTASEVRWKREEVEVAEWREDWLL